MTRLVSALGVLLASASFGAGWTLSSRDVEVLVPVTDRLVLVAAAGQPAIDVREAARAVEEAVQRSGRAKLVMNDAALGPLAASTDDEVHRKAATVPHDVLIIVRVFPQGVDRSLAALVLSTGPGDGPPRSITLKPQEVVVTTAPPPPPPPPEDPNKLEFEAKRLHFGQKSLIPGKKMAAFVYDEPSYEGMKRVTTVQLFERLGRKDFLEATTARASLKLVLGLAAAGVALVGGGLILGDYLSPCARIYQSTVTGYCLQRSAEGLGWAGAATIGAGAVLGIVALALPAYPPSRDEVGKAVEGYNAALRQSLGLSAQVTPDGGRVVVSGQF